MRFVIVGAALAAAVWSSACVAETGGACRDVDGDGYGTRGECTLEGTDCNDGNPLVNPGAPEICSNGPDDDCSEGDAPCSERTCLDRDGDLFGEGPMCAGR